MKKLREFQKFDAEAFLKDKKLVVKEVKDTLEYVDGNQTGTVLGTTIVAAIVEDSTIYSDESTGVNFMETFNIKVSKKDLEIAQGTEIKISNVIKASVYGQFQNNLSVETETIHIAKRKENNE